MEIMVAMMVLAISMTVIMQLFSGGLRSERMSEDYLYALFHARAKMEEILLSEKLSEESIGGEFDGGYKWLVKITAEQPLENKNDIKKLVPFRIDMDVRWRPGRGGKHFSLSTLHLAGKIEEKSEQ